MNLHGTIELGEALQTAVTTAFSEMAFLDVVEGEGAKEITPTSHIVRVSFMRPLRGHIVLYLPLGCKQALVENVYGNAWEALRPTEIDDCLLELGNVLAGNLLTEYCGPDIAHDVGLPEILFDETELRDGAVSLERTFDAEGHSFRITVCLEEPLQQAPRAGA